ncbi:UNVERIFIED_CONTAM: transcriptional regulator [Williamsia faeni]
MRRYSLFGGLSATIDGADAAVGTRKQRAVLAQLILAAGRVVTSDRLIDGIWGDAAPDRAEASLQAYVSGLRRILEPERAPRAQPSVLVTRGSGYALVTTDDEVDLSRFTRAIERARDLHAHHESDTAAAELRSALDMYAPLLPEFEGLSFRDEAAQHVTRLHAAALELSYEIRLDLGETQLLATDLEQALRKQPLNEGLWALLAISRYRMGRQSDALAAVADARRILSDQIGVDPGPTLRALEKDILAQAPHLNPRQHASQNAARSAPVAAEPSVTNPRDTRDTQPAPHTDLPLIGRIDELARISSAISAASGGAGSVIIVEGEAGAGKTSLIDAATHHPRRPDHTLTVWGPCLEGGAAPAMWPWITIVSELVPKLTDAEREMLSGNELGELIDGRDAISQQPEVRDAAARFRLHTQVTALLAQLSNRIPLIVVLDDIQWADSASLELVSHVAKAQLAHVVVICAIRSGDGRARETVRNTLAELSRLPSQLRIAVGPLGNNDIGELILRETGRRPIPQVVESVSRRTKGNAFFARELARTLTDDGELALLSAAAPGSVPAGVRDVVRGRLDQMPTETMELLEVAALIGKRVDLELLAGAASMPIGTVLDTLEPAEAHSVIETGDNDPYTIYFAHDLVREAIVESIPPLRARRLHMKIAGHLTRTGASSRLGELAHHLWSAGPLSERQVTARALLAAAQESLMGFSYESAQSQLEACISLARADGDERLELEAIGLLVAVIGARDGYLAAATEYFDRGEQLAASIGDLRNVADFRYSRWASCSQSLALDRAQELAAEMYHAAMESDDPAIEIIGYQAWGVNEWDRGKIGSSHRSLAHAQEIRKRLDRTSMHGLQHDWDLLGQAFFAWMTTMHVGFESGRDYFQRFIRRTPDAYGRNAACSFAMLAGALSAQPQWTADIGRVWLASVADGPFDFLRAFSESTFRCAEVMLGDHERGLDRLHELRPAVESGPNTGGSAYYGLYAEAALTAGRLDDAAELLEAAQRHLLTFGQRYAEPHLYLTIARHQDAIGDRESARTMYSKARDVAGNQESTTLLQRIESFAPKFAR